MRLLFVHQNFPGQYRHLAAHYARRPGHQVVALGEKRNLLRQRSLPGVKTFGYEMQAPAEGFEARSCGRSSAAAPWRRQRCGCSVPAFAPTSSSATSAGARPYS